MFKTKYEITLFIKKGTKTKIIKCCMHFTKTIPVLLYEASVLQITCEIMGHMGFDLIWPIGGYFIMTALVIVFKSKLCEICITTSLILKQ